MGLDAISPMALALLLLCADPMSADDRSRDLATAIRITLGAPVADVVASSPLPAGNQVGSHYGWRTSARTGERTFHAGTDFLTERGTSVYAVRGGIVETVTRDDRGRRRFRGYGNAVVIHHPDDGRWSLYAHLEGVLVEVGQVVEPGQAIGRVGSTTNGRFPRMVPHLHLEVRRARSDGSSPFPGGYGRHNVDPEDWLEGHGVRFDHDEVSREDPVLVRTDRDGVHHDPRLATSEHGTATF